MRKPASVLIATAIVLFGLFSCRKAAVPQAGSAKAKDLLSLLPKDARGVVVVDVHRIMQTQAVTKAIAENKNKEKYDEFVRQTGIDPQKDVYFFVGAMTGDLGQNVQEGVALVNLRYDKDGLLALIQKEGRELTSSEYNGFTIYEDVEAAAKKPAGGAFLDASNIILGSPDAIKKVIDVYQKKADNIWKNDELSRLLEGMNTESMVWGAFAVPPDALKQAASQNPMLQNFADINAVILSFDYKNQIILAEVKAMSPDAAKNKQMADALNGLKMLGAAAAAKEPQFGELLDKIEISSAADHVKVAANLPEELLQNLGEKMKMKKAEEKPPQED
ncbi:MAG: DUF3352 domain-containing protein [Acidobacteriota bacterium]